MAAHQVHHHNEDHENCVRLLKHLKKYIDIKEFEDFLSDTLKTECLCNAEKFVEEIQIEKQKVEKSSAKSTSMRLKGKELFEKIETITDAINALLAYNESIAYAPNQSQELALSYGDRAMLLFKLKFYNECLADINRALCLNYPDEMMEKLLVLKVRCMKIINHHDLPVIYNDCFKWIDKHSKDPKQSRAEFKKAYREKAQSGSASKSIPFRDALLEELQKSCPDLKKLEIKKSSSGRLTLVAAKDIDVGEVIAVQKMWAQTLRLEKRYVACWQCLVLSMDLIPCHSCTTVMYCSESCKAEAWNKHHEYECQFSFQIERFFPGIALPIRTCVIAMKQLGGILPLMKEVLKMSKLEVEDVRKEKQIVEGKYTSESYKGVYFASTGNFSSFTGCELIERAMQASLFSYYVATGTTFLNEQYQGDWLSVMEERVPKFFAAVLLRHAFMFRSLRKFEISLIHGGTIATTDLCPLFTMMNHSCNPNSVKLTLKTHQILVAVNEIKKGQEINFSFTGKALVKETKIRRNKITRTFPRSSCKCEVCLLEQPPKLRPFRMLERNREKLKELTAMEHKMRDIIFEHHSRLPHTAAEFFQQKTELFENVRPFSTLAPKLCEEAIWLKNYLMENLATQFTRVNHNC